MALKDKMEMTIDRWKSHANLFDHNAKVMDIYEGNLMEYVDEVLRSTLSAQSYTNMKDRIVPINLLKRLVDKLSRIYGPGVVRELVNDNEKDRAVLGWYDKNFQFNYRMNLANEHYNMFKYALVHPVAWQGRYYLRSIPNDKFFVMSDDMIDPLRPTDVVLFSREKTDKYGERTVFTHYTDNEFLIYDDKLRVLSDRMAQFQNPDGVNPIGQLPFIYINRSENLLMPKPDTDLLAMTILMPILLSDLAFAIKFMAFAIVYMIDVDDEEVKRSPNAILMLKTDKDGATEKRPEVGTIKPEIDIDQTMGYIGQTLAMWLQSRGIRPGSVGTLSTENFSSGISKMVDEMDTYEERQKQVAKFEPAEEQLWQLMLHKMQPHWKSKGHIPREVSDFSKTNAVNVTFNEQLPIQNRGSMVKDLEAEVKAGFTTKKRAIRKLNPGLTETELDELLDEITKEKQENAANFSLPGNTSNEAEGTSEEDSA